MNTGFLGPAVATVLTVYGIETVKRLTNFITFNTLQQCLPFTVLKQTFSYYTNVELIRCNSAYRLRY